MQRCLYRALDDLAATPVKLLSLCAGEGRDVLPVLATHPHGRDTDAVLVEVDELLARRAAATALDAGLDRVEVRRMDAGRSDGYADVFPVDVVLLCGIFGNVTVDDIKTTVDAVPAMVREGGLEVAYYGDGKPYGVGVNAVQQQSDGSVPTMLFTFVR